MGPADTQGSSINAGPTDLESTAREVLQELHGLLQQALSLGYR